MRKILIGGAIAGAGVLLVAGVGVTMLVEQGSGGRVIDSPDDCRTALLKTTSCSGEDTSFQECHYHFRAEGIPDRQVCAAYLASGNGASDDRVVKCLETSPAGWTRVPCAGRDLGSSGVAAGDADFVCFACSDGGLENARSLLQAFDRSCQHAVVLKSCNEEE